MSATEKKVLLLSIKRLTRLGRISDKHREDRLSLPDSIFWKIQEDWATAYFDNVETTEEMKARFKNL